VNIFTTFIKPNKLLVAIIPLIKPSLNRFFKIIYYFQSILNNLRFYVSNYELDVSLRVHHFCLFIGYYIISSEMHNLVNILKEIIILMTSYSKSMGRYIKLCLLLQITHTRVFYWQQSYPAFQIIHCIGWFVMSYSYKIR